MLLMKKEYFDAVGSGAKRTTLRYWRRSPPKRGSIHLMPGLGKVRIAEVRAVSCSQLTDADAKADGFESLAELRAALRKLYPPQARKGRKLYQIHFDLLGRPRHC